MYGDPENVMGGATMREFRMLNRRFGSDCENVISGSESDIAPGGGGWGGVYFVRVV